jgi:hypothetical protein
MKKYEPELGQMVNGQPYKEYEASEELVTALECLANCYGILYPEDSNPFRNSGGKYKNDVFEVEAYSWDADYEQPYNFKWKNIEVSWYKGLGRGTTVNRVVSATDIEEMLRLCLISLLKANTWYCMYCGETLEEQGLGFLYCKHCDVTFLPYVSKESNHQCMEDCTNNNVGVKNE